MNCGSSSHNVHYCSCCCGFPLESDYFISWCFFSLSFLQFVTSFPFEVLRLNLTVIRAEILLFKNDSGVTAQQLLYCAVTLTMKGAVRRGLRNN